MTAIELILREMDFAHQNPEDPQEAPAVYKRPCNDISDRWETITLNGRVGIDVSSDHTTEGEVWHHKENADYIPQTLDGLAQAMALLDMDRKNAPKERPIPEWDWTGNGDEVDLIHNGRAVAELQPRIKDCDLTGLATQIVAALSGKEDPRIHALKAHLLHMITRYDARNVEGISPWVDDDATTEARKACQ
jgi:hypothetical protein